MGKYQAYAEYKNSGVEWLGEIPEHWSIHSLKRAVNGVTNGVWGNEPDGENDLVVLRVADFNREQLNISDDKLTLRSIVPKDRNSRLLKKGDLLIEKSGGGDKTLVGCVVIFNKNYPAVTSNFVAKMTPKKYFCSSFLLYAFYSLYAGKVNLPSIKQTTGIQNLDSDAYLMEKFSFPIYDEQQTIAAFLDHETAKIDALIEKQQQLISLLQEKRQAVISHAVTKGLNPDVPMKDSGVEWLGQVPEHWSILKFGVTNKSAELGGNYNSGESEEGLPLIKMGNLGRGDISLKKIEYLPIAEDFDKAHLLKSGDFLFNTRNSLDLVGKVSIWKNELPRALYNSNVLRISFEPTLVYSSQYMSYLFNSDLGLSQLRLIAKGTTSVAAIYYKDLKSISFPLPTLKEQEEIVEYVEKNIEKLDELIKQSQKAIQLIKERKTALISAAVTGKIDVRDWEPQGVQG